MFCPPDAQPESRFGTWDSAITGKFRPGRSDRARSSPAQGQGPACRAVLEECKHGMQISGLCVLCGKDMTNSDYIGFADSSRAHIQMTILRWTPVSLEEAQRLEKETADDLLKSRKLSLIVDLDQTIVHATVDPTVGEWRSEGAAWKARHAAKKTDSDSEDECNPNWEALEDIEHDGPVYYIKRRPGWQEFLDDMATKYQMHVYTMGTRAYAEQVCALIDPTGKVFGGQRQPTQKSLQRLFPCDTSMVVIIDDRADVWEWSPNLIKVVPCAASNPLAPGAVSPVEAAQTELTEKAMLTQNTIALEAQVEERPLAKKQEELQVASAEAPAPIAASEAETPDSTSPASEKTQRKAALLKNDDNELQRLGKLFGRGPRRFFTAYETRREEEKAKAGASRKRRDSIKPKPAYDVTVQFISDYPAHPGEVLEGVHILFSSVIPLDTNPEATEIWRMALMFGAKCSTELTAEVTHVVAAKRGTVKVDAARKRGGIKIVWVAWFTDCIALWQRQDEASYLLDDGPTVPAGDPLQEEEWDGGGGGEGGANRDLAIAAINWTTSTTSDDDEDARSERSGMSEDDWTDDASSVQTNSGPSTPTRLKRKRLRSVTPSADGVNGSGTRDALGSPLAKRKKVAAERTGYSKLKEAISADEIQSGSAAAAGSESGLEKQRSGSVDGGEGEAAQVSSPASRASDEGMQREGDEEEEEDGGDDDDDDDFLARELEEEWG
ncbi:hypothetical protein B0H17DRAFT_1109791 [Mycena rosella]|uniref:RNA polymerase II subunit A C-terminal domain phosphatase n=1 Tax=Mycena rosella TaxID=1033263 RepID=A0AAD7FKF6_MYCRO|nr:hypothetical protein B0H17DRAFT_1109791 [Mycena rosella]